MPTTPPAIIDRSVPQLLVLALDGIFAQVELCARALKALPPSPSTSRARQEITWAYEGLAAAADALEEHQAESPVEPPELRPCPWCGEPPSAQMWSEGQALVGCQSESCEATPSILRRDLQAAAAAWNVRTL